MHNIPNEQVFPKWLVFQLVLEWKTAIISGPEVIKLFSCSTEFSMKILNAHTYKTIKEFYFLGSDKPGILFFQLINVKMPTINIYEQEKFLAQLS